MAPEARRDFGGLAQKYWNETGSGNLGAPAASMRPPPERCMSSSVRPRVRASRRASVRPRIRASRPRVCASARPCAREKNAGSRELGGRRPPKTSPAAADQRACYVTCYIILYVICYYVIYIYIYICLCMYV